MKAALAAALMLAALPAHAEDGPPPCRATADDRIECPRLVLEDLRTDLRDAQTEAAVMRARLGDCREDMRAAVELELDLAGTRERGLRAEIDHWRARAAPAAMTWKPWALGTGGAIMASAGVACLSTDGCPVAAGWGALALGLASAAFGLGITW